MAKTYIDTRSEYWAVTGTFEQNKACLMAADHEDLVALIINNQYNDFLSQRAEYRDEDVPVDPTAANGRSYGKRVPYIGWFWRATDFYHKNIPIGDCGDFVGVMENNKWDYPERNLTEAECDQVIAIIDAAMAESRKSGAVTDIRANTMRELERLWPLFQTFTINEEARP